MRGGLAQVVDDPPAVHTADMRAPAATGALLAADHDQIGTGHSFCLSLPLDEPLIFIQTSSAAFFHFMVSSCSFRDRSRLVNPAAPLQLSRSGHGSCRKSRSTEPVRPQLNCTHNYNYCVPYFEFAIARSCTWQARASAATRVSRSCSWTSPSEFPAPCTISTKHRPQ